MHAEISKTMLRVLFGLVFGLVACVKEKTELYELSFHPDGNVEAFTVPGVRLRLAFVNSRFLWNIDFRPFCI